jgi:hypothetical protein
MRAIAFRLALLVACLSLGAVAFPQEGHPLKGSWSGDWGSTAAQRSPLLIVMDFDGQIMGTINPGSDNFVIKNATLDPKAWLLHLEADTRDKSGQTIKLIMDGRIENIALYNRSIKGTWSTPTAKGDFKVTRSKGN